MVFWDTSPPSCLSVGWPNKVTIPLTQQLVCGFIWLSGCEQYMLGLRNTCIAPTQTKYSIWFPHHINAFHQRASPSRPWLPVLWGVWAPSPLSSQCLCPDLWTTRERLPTPVFWPGEFHGLYSPWGSKELDMTATFTFWSLLFPWVLFVLLSLILVGGGLSCLFEIFVAFWKKKPLILFS